MNPIQLEEAYKDFTANLSKWAPDGCIEVNLQLLQSLGLLRDWDDVPSSSESLSQQFHVIETHEKVTLFNDQFAVWIVPQTHTQIPSTLVMLALIQHKKPHLEIVYTTSGVYNTPKYILKLLQHFINEVIDTESVISSIDTSSG
ncbi:MAG: hypothetical protein FJZ58_05935 [Chlamydiae bacterium]|nr:hypothetical protein [Chlamydiota bacterium]